MKINAMKIETVGSFLPEETLMAARQDFDRSIIDRPYLTSIEDDAGSERHGKFIGGLWM